MKIAIVGYGIIGKATHLGLLNNAEIIISDINIAEYKSTSVEYCDLVFVCVPTSDDRELNSLRDLCQTLATTNPNAEIVIRSTIPPSYIDLINDACCGRLVYCPEFLRERKWQTDCFTKPILVASNLTMSIFFRVVPEVDCCRVSLHDAAIIKLMTNVFNSMRITFANHVYEYCKSTGADFNNVVTFLKNHQSTNEQSYLEVSEMLRGFGGKCLPKDVKLCIADFLKQDLNQTLFTAIDHDNNNWPVTVRKDT